MEQIFDGYIKIDQPGKYFFAADGDDAVEFNIFRNSDYNLPSLVGSIYSSGGCNICGSSSVATAPAYSSPPSENTDGTWYFNPGIYRFRFRQAKYNGYVSVYGLWRQPNEPFLSSIPEGQFGSNKLSNFLTNPMDAYIFPNFQDWLTSSSSSSILLHFRVSVPSGNKVQISIVDSATPRKPTTDLTYLVVELASTTPTIRFCSKLLNANAKANCNFLTLRTISTNMATQEFWIWYRPKKNNVNEMGTIIVGTGARPDPRVIPLLSSPLDTTLATVGVLIVAQISNTLDPKSIGFAAPDSPGNFSDVYFLPPPTDLSALEYVLHVNLRTQLRQFVV